MLSCGTNSVLIFCNAIALTEDSVPLSVDISLRASQKLNEPLYVPAVPSASEFATPRTPAASEITLDSFTFIPLTESITFQVVPGVTVKSK